MRNQQEPCATSGPRFVSSAGGVLSQGCTGLPTHQKEPPGPADVTHPASVIERDANPTPLQSLAVGAGWGEGGVGQGGTLKGTRGRKLDALQHMKVF